MKQNKIDYQPNLKSWSIAKIFGIIDFVNYFILTFAKSIKTIRIKMVNIGLKMSELVRAIGKEIHIAFMNNGDISIEFYFLLNVLYERDNVILHDLANILKKDKSLILRHIDSLEKKKLVVRIPDADDRRKKTIVLTKDGVKMVEKLREVDANVFNSFLEGVPEQDLVVFESVLDKMKFKAK